MLSGPLSVQVEDVDNKFAELSKLRSNNWVKEEKPQPKKKKVSKVQLHCLIRIPRCT